jgi:hypothetical protein
LTSAHDPRAGSSVNSSPPTNPAVKTSIAMSPTPHTQHERDRGN